MTIERVREDSLVAGIAYLVGLGALLARPDRLTADQDVVLLVGVVIFALTWVVVDWLVFKRRPRLGLGLRPSRYSIPSAFGIFPALLYLFSLRSSDAGDRGLLGYAVATLLILAGSMASNLWWAHAVRSSAGDIQGR